MAIVGPKPWVNAFGTCQLSDFLNFLFYSLERSFFVVKYRKRHYPCLYCSKKTAWNIGHVWPKQWVNHFGKILIFGPC